jgi:hypothetical protein
MVSTENTACKHNWHFIPGTDRLRCARCGAETGPSTPEQLTQDMLRDVITMGSAWSQGGKRIDPREVYADPIMTPFEHWWYHEGSGPPRHGDDAEEHCKRMCKIAWDNGVFKERERSAKILEDNAAQCTKGSMNEYILISNAQAIKAGSVQ